MSNQPKKTRKPTAQSAQRRTPAVRLSQCMIVKNEEKDIERALTWAKDVAFEQIVVDTGSTDKTVEIAERMGAKVFHFDWIDDFSAAKNFAIQQCSGNWIAFLDADEYLNEEDAAKVLPMLRRVWGGADGRNIMGVLCPLENLDDAGNTFLVAEQQRFFRNLPSVRYVNKIHEHLIFAAGHSHFTGEVKIKHTGYAPAIMRERGKGSRNVEILRRELEKKPDDLNLKGYLADALSTDDSDPRNAEETAALYRELVESRQPLNEVVTRSSHEFVVRDALSGQRFEEMADVAARGAAAMPNAPDFKYWRGYALYQLERYAEAWEAFTDCEKSIEGHIITRLNEDSMGAIFKNMAQTAVKLQNWHDSFKYVTLALTQDKYQQDMVVIGLVILRTILKDDDKGILDYLRKFYDFDDAHDKLFLAKSAKTANDEVLMVLFYQLITPEDRASFSSNVIAFSELAQ